MLKTLEIVKILESQGFTFKRASKHMIYVRGVITVAVPRHKVCSKGLVRRLFQQAGFEKDFIKNLID